MLNVTINLYNETDALEFINMLAQEATWQRTNDLLEKASMLEGIIDSIRQQLQNMKRFHVESVVNGRHLYHSAFDSAEEAMLLANEVAACYDIEELTIAKKILT